jgi:hypothetical protein
VKTPRPNAKKEHERRTTLILAGVIALLSLAIVIVAGIRYL